MFNKRELKANDIYSIESSDENYSLLISNVSINHKGKYTMEAKNEMGSIFTDFEIDVLSMLTIIHY